MNTSASLEELLGAMFQAHPWHGVPPGQVEDWVNTFIEIVPTDVVKYEVEKRTGHLHIDRPQRYSSFSPTPYGFIPRTFCGRRVGERCTERTGIQGLKGDGDPLDICVLTEKVIAHGNLFVRARPIGGLRMIDRDEADDKIVSVLVDDLTYGRMQDISECPQGVVDRLKHYFSSYKQLPEDIHRKVLIAEVYDRAEALEVIRRSIEDYREKYGTPEERLEGLRRLLAGGR